MGTVPPDGFRCLYVLDGDDHFTMFVEQAASMLAERRAAPVIVGIGFTEDAGTVERRIHDLTPRAVRYDMPDRPNGEPWPKLGGGDDFLETVERDIRPRVAVLCGGNPSSNTLFGHSLGGLMVLHAFSSYTDNYDRYFAASPSIWFNRRKIVADVVGRLGRPFPHPVALRVAVGGAEEDPGSKGHGPDSDPALRAAWVASNRMVGNARDLARIINRRKPEGLAFAFDELPDADHRSILPFAARKALGVAAA